ncbi:DUF1810 domain-containing protein [Pseudoroseicyclus tamaricis]|uniref:DUF1810 domain-containing protein n=1 Tax=Pseudoroseicyclus tamaricis TaxID=2705421 RepID=A0A6B2K6Z4_9RHOB|nr:DUF1810 domain-containing protein [Pseudoroseicyclus tamaricis]NDV02716.1 DUF1810 domain-containing protein [Pseudoroseicyclus tamaricis]
MAELSDFVEAQDRVWPDVQEELAAGRKRSHWMWYVFPQLASLGRSPMAQHYGLAGPEEAAAYLAHPVLGPRLQKAAELALSSGETNPERLMGPVDALKLRSSMTLFETVPGAPAVFSQILLRFYDGTRDPLTLDALA